MAKIRVGGLGRLLLIVVAVALALPLVAHPAYGERTATRSAAAGDGRAESPGTARWGSDLSENPESGSDRCQPRRGGRSAATLSAPRPPLTTVSATGPVRAEGALTVTAPLTGRQAVPLSRSGELPVRHLVFRC
ncbi:hypothetical protein AB0G60_34315 [Streptomyces angustmyceticus]|uniref:Uncharacterized protein n=1 Tax=Streptomyces angustmyceticus TaxID=285578 RepID=A0A5J4LAA0_9ACTN|nr:hypothetical protein [Streptomyces angustmyceticus]UAL67766.1 hypothetical protein K7396_15560 [Streptomyces angustmyceticus]GES31123.1 hypothetical protein San01_36100 [Streptomyces angustmyceticus]